MIICVVGDTEDLSSVYLGWAARRAGHRVLELDEECLGSSWSFGFEGVSPGEGTIRVEGDTIRMGDVTGAFSRFAPEPSPPPGLGLDEFELERFRAERRCGLHELLERLPCPVANRPSAGRSNGSKPLQMARLEAAGFRVPPWIATNERPRVDTFLEGLGGKPAIYKAVSGLRSRVRRVDAELLDRLERGTGPVVVQAYIEGTDVRVHVVDETCLGTAVEGVGVDYRFDGSRSYREQEVPSPIAALCRRVAVAEGLLLAGFDFRVDARGEWFSLEVNPMPSFIPYQWCTGQPIAEAVIEAFVTRREIHVGRS